MKYFITLLLVAVVCIIVAEAYPPTVQKPNPEQPQFPTCPGYGPFNPRVRRSPQNKGQVSIDVRKDGSKTSWNVEAQRKIYENRHGSIQINGGINKHPGSKPQGQIGIGGQFKF